MKTRNTILAVVTVAALLQATTNIGVSSVITTQATNPPYLSQFPSVERVKTGIKGADAMDTAARQMGAFWQLQEIIKTLSGLRWARNELTADEGRLLGLYSAGYHEAAKPYASYPDRPKWFNAHSFYEVDEGFREELFKLFLSPALREQFFRVKGETKAVVQQRKEARAQALKKAPAATQPVAPTNPCPITDQPKTTKPGVRPNSTLSVIGMGYVYTVTNLKTGAVVSQTRGNFSNATLYLLDEDAENVLQSAGMGPGLMGDRFTMLAFTQGVAQGEQVPVVGELLSTPIGQDAAAMASEAKADLECVMRAVRAHSAAEMTTDANARGTFPSVPAGTYYLYGWYYRVREPVRAGPVAWNLKVELKPGPNTLRLTVDDAAYAP